MPFRPGIDEVAARELLALAHIWRYEAELLERRLPTPDPGAISLRHCAWRLELHICNGDEEAAARLAGANPYV